MKKRIAARKSPKKREDRFAATVTVYGASQMTTQGKAAVAKWIIRQAEMLVKQGHKYSSRFTGKYYY